jgi:RNA polymerase sigma factor (sigma-70 family)
MGAVSVDLNKRERIYEARYPLDNPFGVRHLFEDYGKLETLARKESDFDALIVLMDFEQALIDAKLTTKQKEALFLVFIAKLTQEEAAAEMGIDQSKVSTRVDRAINKVAESQGYDEEVYVEKHGH